MRGLLLSFVVGAAACSAKPRRAFPIGVVGPVSPRVAAEARRLGLATAEAAPAGAAAIAAASPLEGGGESTLDWARLRLEGARAAAGGAGGVYFRLPSVPDGRDLLDFPEEWQAVARVARELVLMRPVVEGGESAALPFSVPAGLEGRAWMFEGRVYVLLVNPSGRLLPLDDGAFAGRRALFAVRSDARQDLPSCPGGHCLPPGGVLWLEGRLGASGTP